MAKRLTSFILVALIMGIICGFAINRFVIDKATLQQITIGLDTISGLFLKLIRMIIAPLILGTLVSGLAHVGDRSEIGRLGVRTLGWFVLASIVSLLIGLVMANILRPGDVGGMAALAHGAPAITMPFSLQKFVLDLVPDSIFNALARNDVLPIVMFSVLAGVAATALGDRATPIVRAAKALSDLMLVITHYVMKLAPIAVFAAVTNVISVHGIGILKTYGYLLSGFYLSLLLLCLILYAVAVLAIGRGHALFLLRSLRPPLLLAFSTASSEAAFPRTLEALEESGVPPRIAGFVLPLGYSFNLDGSMMYCSFATIFIAQVYGISLSWEQQLLMMLLLMVTSKGIASVPRSSLVVISSTLAFFDIPEGGIILLLAVDQFLDMGRSATSVLGNSVASVLVAKWDGAMEAPNCQAREHLG